MKTGNTVKTARGGRMICDGDDTFRIAFYVTYFPSFFHDSEQQAYRVKCVPKGTKMSPLGKWVAGTNPYPDQYKPSPEQIAYVNLDSVNNKGQWGL